MRDLKFRGKNIANGKWVVGDSIKHTMNHDGGRLALNTYIGARVENARRAGAMKWPVVDPSTVGQFTGLLDRNGKEIYEGDILNFVPESNLLTVKWDADGLFGLYNKAGIYECCFVSFEIRLGTVVDVEVIGNIHDNPDMTHNAE